MTSNKTLFEEGDLPRDFASREALDHLLKLEFPDSHGKLSPVIGGRKSAEALLKNIDVKKYAISRNFINGSVTRLSPYIRHGVITLAEVRNEVFKKIRNKKEGEKLIQELGWRDFWQRVWKSLGNKINLDQEEHKTGIKSIDYGSRLNKDIITGSTGLACMDYYSQELVLIGWLHNHARMWLASYIIHWRQVHWKAGADWFLEHLIDGDPSSNNLSWQWIASCFSKKPYFFNRDNFIKYSGEDLCSSCQKYEQCPFEGTYSQLEQKLFNISQRLDIN